MPTYQVQQIWRAKRPKTGVSHDLENPPQPSKNEFAEGCRKSNSILNLEYFLSLVSYGTTKRKKKIFYLK